LFCEWIAHFEAGACEELHASSQNVAAMNEEPTDDSSPKETTLPLQDAKKPDGGEGGLLNALDDSKKRLDIPAAQRPDQVANAVAFLTNPKVVVRGSALSCLPVNPRYCAFQ
jgi:hypothetical protein